ncbi:hypothetical protein AeRB84_008041 [Aphanomyces euteiches]|nr:hypothetical protein AeRB84_009584 [Aphanomyces euteiches]KAH9148714.1 hypothetical protein AeRB84_008041 [Aphanomyces euteiches]
MKALSASLALSESRFADQKTKSENQLRKIDSMTNGKRAFIKGDPTPLIQAFLACEAASSERFESFARQQLSSISTIKDVIQKEAEESHASAHVIDLYYVKTIERKPKSSHDYPLIYFLSSARKIILMEDDDEASVKECLERVLADDNANRENLFPFIEFWRRHGSFCVHSLGKSKARSKNIEDEPPNQCFDVQHDTNIVATTSKETTSL